MAANRKPQAAMPYDRWELLGTRLASRRGELGYSTRADLARARRIREMTCEYIETATAGRVERLDVTTLRLIARAYAVTYESMLALLHGGTDKLEPVSPAEPPAPRARPAANRKRLAIWAPEDRWKLLGELLEERRRVHFGQEFRNRFARARLPLTPDGNPNTRRVDDLESNRRPNRWPPGTLKEMAAAYEVTYESVQAVLYGSSDALAPAVPAPAAVPDLTPPLDPVRTASARPWFDEINERRVALAARGITDPSGAQMFPDRPDDAQAWDGIGARLDIGARVWFIADLRRRAAGRAGNSGTGVTGA